MRRGGRNDESNTRAVQPVGQHPTNNSKLWKARLTSSLIAIKLGDKQAAAVFQLFVRLLRRPATHAEALIAYPAITHVIAQHAGLGADLQPLVCHCCQHLWMLWGARTERAAHMQLAVLTLLRALCNGHAGRWAILHEGSYVHVLTPFYRDAAFR